MVTMVNMALRSSWHTYLDIRNIFYSVIRVSSSDNGLNQNICEKKTKFGLFSRLISIHQQADKNDQYWQK